MWSPLGPALVNIFMCSFEIEWVKDCAHGLKSVFYRWNVHHIFDLFSFLNHAEKFKKYLSFRHPNMRFLLVKENDRCLCS